ncbi:hypothetical protein [Zobellella sp. An-6]|uniref:hypothetical protein n=1 Tax=Zobellella sp. An-6 TaxID=3400218 RepID=UPI0040418030
MKILMYGLLAVGLAGAYSSIGNADEWASSASTPGHGRMEVVTNYLIFSSGKYYDVEIPRRVASGRKISIRYLKDGEWVQDSFVVAGISTKKDLCRLHNKLPSKLSTSPGDTIYIQPCRYQP